MGSPMFRAAAPFTVVTPKVYAPHVSLGPSYADARLVRIKDRVYQVRTDPALPKGFVALNATQRKDLDTGVGEIVAVAPVVDASFVALDEVHVHVTPFALSAAECAKTIRVTPDDVRAALAGQVVTDGQRVPLTLRDRPFVLHFTLSARGTTGVMSERTDVGLV